MTFTKRIKSELLSSCDFKKNKIVYLKSIIFCSTLVESCDKQLYIQIKLTSFVRNVLNEIENDYTIHTMLSKDLIVLDFSHSKESGKTLWLLCNNFIENKVLTDIYNKNERREFMKASFILNGTMINPANSYHLEIKIHQREYCHTFCMMLNVFDIEFKKIKRGNFYIAYIKESDKIADYLRVVKASKSLMEFEDYRIIKEVRNKINRRQNYELANLSRTITTAVRQKREIEYILKTLKKEDCPKDLLQLMNLRLSTDNISLKELGDLHDPKLSKSSVNYKFKKIKTISENLRRR